MSADDALISHGSQPIRFKNQIETFVLIKTGKFSHANLMS